MYIKYLKNGYTELTKKIQAHINNGFNEKEKMYSFKITIYIFSYQIRFIGGFLNTLHSIIIILFFSDFLKFIVFDSMYIISG